MKIANVATVPQSATPSERALAPAQKRRSQTRRGRRGRDRTRARRLLLTRSPPTRPQRRCRFPHRPPTTGSPTHAEPPSNIPLRLARRSELPGSRTQLRDPSPEHPPAGAGALDFRQRTCDEQRSWPAPEYEHDQPSRTPRTPGPPRQPQPQYPRATNHTTVVNPCPLTTTPPFGRRRRVGPGPAPDDSLPRRRSLALGACRTTPSGTSGRSGRRSDCSVRS